MLLTTIPKWYPTYMLEAEVRIDSTGSQTAVLLTQENNEPMAYIGCYKDANNRDLPHSQGSSNITPLTCNDLCKEDGYTFFGVQSTNQCFCGNSYGKHGKMPESSCSRKCTADNAYICGGTWRNSIYKVGTIDGVPEIRTDGSDRKVQVISPGRVFFKLLCYNFYIAWSLA